MKNSDIEPIFEFLTESERNLEIATAIFENYKAVRQEIVRAFFERVSASLRKSLPGWISRYGSPFFDMRYGGFDLWKPAWEERYRIRIEAYEYGHSMGFGVWRDPERLAGVRLSPDLLSSVRASYPEAGSRDYYEAEIEMTSPSADWRKPRTLWRLQSDPSFQLEIEQLLCQIVTLTESHVDVLAKAADSKRKL